jgi:hypothetical protein
MHCCGNAKSKPGLSNARALPQNTATVVTQPGFQPTMEEPIRFSGVPPPPQVHTNTDHQQPQMADNLQWRHASGTPSSPNRSDFGSFRTATSSSPFRDWSPISGQTSDTSSQTSHLRSASPSTLNKLYDQLNTPQQDQEKMSVSIDFGRSFAFTPFSQSLFLIIAIC